MKLNKIIINVKNPPDSFLEILDILHDKYKDIEFLGWCLNVKIVRIEGINYKVINFLRTIILKETKVNNISVPNYLAKNEIFKIYTMHIEKLKSPN